MPPKDRGLLARLDALVALVADRLRHAWTQIDESLRAGLVYAAWCQQVTLTG